MTREQQLELCIKELEGVLNDLSKKLAEREQEDMALARAGATLKISVDKNYARKPEPEDHGRVQAYLNRLTKLGIRGWEIEIQEAYF